MSLITINEFKLFNKINTADPSLDDFIQNIISYAQKQAEEYVNYNLEFNTYEELINGNGLDRVYPYNIPIKNVYEVTKYDSKTKTFVELRENVDYNRLIFDNHSIILDGYIFEIGMKNYKVKYEAGYTDSDVPANVKLGLLELATIYFNESKQGEGNLIIASKNKAQTGASENYDKDIEMKILERRFGKYVKPNV